MLCSSNDTANGKRNVFVTLTLYLGNCVYSNLPPFHLRCRLSARCEGTSGVQVFEVLGGTDKLNRYEDKLEQSTSAHTSN